jgi:hypothetical protein
MGPLFKGNGLSVQAQAIQDCRGGDRVGDFAPVRGAGLVVSKVVGASVLLEKVWKIQSACSLVGIT